MTEEVFSHFQFRTGMHVDGSTFANHFRLQLADADSGRFWLGFMCALRKLVPGVGQAVLAGLVDHHRMVNASALNSLAAELADWDGTLIIENGRFVASAPWWPQFEHWQNSLTQPVQIVIWPYEENLSDGNPAPSIPAIIAERLSQLPLSVRGLLAGSEVWWLDWLLEDKGLQGFAGIIDLLKENGMIEIVDRWHLAIPSWNIQQALIYSLKTIDFEQASSKIREMQVWLEQRGQWLECVRCDLLLRDYEQAGWRFENYSDYWLSGTSHASAIEQLFWLRELPSVLLPTKPLLCLQAASAAQQLGLVLPVSYYCNLASQQLYSLRRLARNETEWLSMHVNEAGHTIASLIEKIEILTGGS